MGIDGNAFFIMGYVLNAMKVAYCSATLPDKEQFGPEAQIAYKKSAMSGDYNNLICVSQKMIEKVNESLKLEPSYEEDEDFYDDNDEDYEDDYDDYCADEFWGDDYSEDL